MDHQYEIFSLASWDCHSSVMKVMLMNDKHKHGAILPCRQPLFCGVTGADVCHSILLFICGGLTELHFKILHYISYNFKSESVFVLCFRTIFKDLFILSVIIEFCQC